MKLSFGSFNTFMLMAMAMMSTNDVGTTMVAAANNNGIGTGNGAGNGSGNPPAKDPEEDVDLLVQYTNVKGKNAAMQYANNGKLERDIPSARIVAIKSKRKNIAALSDNPFIEHVGLDMIHTTLGFPDDLKANDGSNHGPYLRKLAEDGYSTLYGLSQVQADLVPQSTAKFMKVCVIDTGYGLGHSDLPSTGVTGINPYSTGQWDVDGHGHGTHCAGTIGAIGGNDNGITSVNPDPSKFNFMIGKGLQDSGSGSTSAILQAGFWCANNGANIISMSLGCNGCSDSSVRSQWETIYNNGVLIVAAAGNSGNSNLSFPASYPSIMSVAATTSTESRASFSQYNNQVEIAAPGYQIKSTIPTDTYATWSGTSMATPHVAGVAALVWSHHPECTNKQIRNVLLASAKDKDTAGCDNYYGYGIVQAKAALDLLNANGCDAYTSTNDAGGCGQTWTTSPPPPPPPTVPPFNNPCASNENFVKVTIVTDNYGGETEWKVRDSNLRTTYMQARRGSLGSNQQYVQETCIPNSGQVYFEIKDRYGDGICCQYGNGSYTVQVNANIAGQGGQFAVSEVVNLW